MLVEPSKLVPWERNPRHNDGAVDKVAASIKELGFGAPIVARKGSNEIIAGHTRWKAAQKLGLEVVPVRFLDISDEKAQTMALADNKLGEIADWDNELLQEIALDLGDDLMDLAGFDEPLTEVEEVEGNTDPDDVPEAPEEPTTKPGDLWILGDHRLLCGDSTNIQHVEKLMGGQKADMVFTDPPYGISYKSPSGSGMAKRGDYAVIKGDEDPYDPSPLFGHCDLIVTWGANHYADKLPPSKAWLVWDKREGDAINNNSDCELAWVSLGGSARLFHHKWNGMIKASEKKEKRVHPTQKPVALAEWAFELLDAGEFIIDLYGGSGSTLIACEKTRRKARLMELDPKYCDVIVKRWEDFTGNKAELADG